jgi:RNA-directed DNA polymerase
VLDCDVQSFFDKVSQSWLMRFVEHRIGDRRIIRLIAKWLTAGVLEDGHLTVTEEGTPIRIIFIRSVSERRDANTH